MRIRTLSSIVLALAPVSVVAESPEEARRKALEAPTCHNAMVALESHLDTLPTTCTDDAGCAVGYFHVDSCLPPYVHAGGYDANADKKLLELQGAARNACSDELSKKPACSPQPEPVTCREGRCIATRHLPPPTPSKATFNATYKHLRIEAGCAPHDAPSWILTITPTKEACGTRPTGASIGVNWWGKRPVLPAKAVKISADLSAGICERPGVCTSVSSFELVLDTLDAKSGRGRLHLATPSGDTVDATVDAVMCPEQPSPCG